MRSLMRSFYRDVIPMRLLGNFRQSIIPKPFNLTYGSCYRSHEFLDNLEKMCYISKKEDLYFPEKEIDTINNRVYIFNDVMKDHLDKLNNHPVLALQRNSDIRFFMENNIFSVWNSMKIFSMNQYIGIDPNLSTLSTDPSFLKLNRNLTYGEESYVFRIDNQRLKVLSPVELHMYILEYINGSTSEMVNFMKRIEISPSLFDSFSKLRILNGVKDFMKESLSNTFNMKKYQSFSYFLFGKRDYTLRMICNFIPDKNFVEYLERYNYWYDNQYALSELKLLAHLCDTETKRNEAIEAGIKAINLKIKLWDEIYTAIEEVEFKYH